MDEPTSSLDAKTESKIINSIKPFLKNRTSVIVSHYLKNITFVDEIIVLSKGKIVEHGTHNELLTNRSYYYDLWETQNIALK